MIIGKKEITGCHVEKIETTRGVGGVYSLRKGMK